MAISISCEASSSFTSLVRFDQLKLEKMGFSVELHDSNLQLILVFVCGYILADFDSHLVGVHARQMPKPLGNESTFSEKLKLEVRAY